MEFQQIESFVEVNKQLNFSKAAEKLHITQSTISTRIHKLEVELGSQLFLRLGSHGIRLSSYGEIFLPYALECLEIINQGLLKLNEFNVTLSSKLSISAANPVSTLILPQLLPILYETFPEMEVDVLRYTGFSEDIFKLVAEEQIDIGFINDGRLTYSKIDKSRVFATPLFENDMVLIVGKQNKLALADYLDMTEISKQKMIYMGERTSVAKHVKTYFGVHHIEPLMDIEINNISAIKEMIKRTDMVSVLPRLMIDKELRTGDLVEVLLQSPPPPMISYLICRQTFARKEIAEMIKNNIVQIIKESGFPCNPLT